MRKNIGFLLIIGIAALSLSGCLYHWTAGPCYGVGCPSYTTSAQPKVAEIPKAPDGNAQSQKSGALERTVAGTPQAGPSQIEASQGEAAQAKPGMFTRMLTALHLHSKS